MSVSFGITAVSLMALLFFFAAIVEGSSGFGFPVISTVTLALFIDLQLAVILAIPGIVAANIKLARSLSPRQKEEAATRFWPLIGSILVFSVLGLFVIDDIPVNAIEFGLGIITLGFAIYKQPFFEIPISDEPSDNPPFGGTGSMIVLGGIFGLIFGMTNVGVQIVAYLKTRPLSHLFFIGVVGIVFFGVNIIRFIGAAVGGLYPTLTVIGIALLLMIPAYIGALIGIRYGRQLSLYRIRALVAVVLTIVSLRLIGFPILQFI
ncbi:sulfite exporter TauE/SafE family protein [Salinarchaeum sp. IM2453]|uniref:sulfite exporter TauE/SafE family protein n=1 Tax=Salinarchaeum sp. IM2453 TaxID=2862870 RepID=UPI001C831820|nr:sulfite exporter TauE/SafE family protein [Salinarchaeum sp. IM2453]QZA88416.1 sulfite exporter TauE/SafE family protein [Salinarchaeum sp. IM2453]